MKHSIKTGLSFGLTSGIITTLGLIVGLNSGTHSKLAVIGGILTIAIADAFSDAFGIHISEESENKHTEKEVWEATILTFLAKFIFSLSFAIPILIFSLSFAIVFCIIWGFLLIGIFSYIVSKGQDKKPHKVVIEHLIITLLVILLAHYIGSFIDFVFR